jgi:hypothetical protein
LTDTEEKRRQNRERTRLYRQRKTDDIIVLRLTVPRSDLAAVLVASERLDRHKARNRAAIQQAFREAIADWIVVDIDEVPP